MLEGPMYAVGGHDGWSYLNTVERWDPQARQWNYVASMSTPRSTVGVAALNSKYVNRKNFFFLCFLPWKSSFLYFLFTQTNQTPQENKEKTSCTKIRKRFFSVVWLIVFKLSVTL